jgi:hypothetical protein
LQIKEEILEEIKKINGIRSSRASMSVDLKRDATTMYPHDYLGEVLNSLGDIHWNSYSTLV